MTDPYHGAAAVAEPGPVELRFAVDGREAPLVYPDSVHVEPVEDLAVEVAGPGVLATLVVPVGRGPDLGRGTVLGRVGRLPRSHRRPPRAHRFRVGVAACRRRLRPGPGLLVEGDDDQPARVRFHIAVDIDGLCLSTADLRAGLVDALTGRFNVARIGVSQGEPRAGHIH
jgi:hypothetical protein